MLAVLFLILLSVCVLAPFMGTDTTDASREHARPTNGWFPPLQRR